LLLGEVYEKIRKIEKCRYQRTSTSPKVKKHKGRSDQGMIEYDLNLDSIFIKRKENEYK
jgi:hypothetical protein